MEPMVFARYPGLDALRTRRAELFESMGALEQALAAPTSQDLAMWTKRVNLALAELVADVNTHVAITEGVDGLHGEVVAIAPRLAYAVNRLVGEHAIITEVMDELAAGAPHVTTVEQAERLRDVGSDLLTRLVKHRQRGADLVFEAFHTDIGGET